MAVAMLSRSGTYSVYTYVLFVLIVFRYSYKFLVILGYRNPYSTLLFPVLLE